MNVLELATQYHNPRRLTPFLSQYIYKEDPLISSNASPI
jgi:hypothetical protein